MISEFTHHDVYQLCWRYNKNDCHSKGEISIKNCGSYYVYGIATPPPNNQYGHCVGKLLPTTNTLTVSVSYPPPLPTTTTVIVSVQCCEFRPVISRSVKYRFQG